MGSRSGRRGPSRERDRNSTCRSGSKRRGRGKGEVGGRGDVGADVLNSENNGRTRWQTSLIGSQTNRGTGGVYVEVISRVQSKRSRALHAHRGKKLLQDPQTLESAAMTRAVVRFRGAREKGAMVFVECLRSLARRYDGRTPVEGDLRQEPGVTWRGETCWCDVLAMVAGKKLPASTPYLAQRRDGALVPTIGRSARYSLDLFARAKSSLLLKKHGPFEREIADKTAD